MFMIKCFYIDWLLKRLINNKESRVILWLAGRNKSMAILETDPGDLHLIWQDGHSDKRTMGI